MSDNTALQVKEELLEQSMSMKTFLEIQVGMLLKNTSAED